MISLINQITQTTTKLLSILFFSVYCASATELLEQHSSYPLQAESTLDSLEPWETPISGFFVRSHHRVPTHIDVSKWTLKIDGLVKKPVSLTLKQLKQMPHKKLHAVLECSGNGRALQTPSVAGVPWKKGAVGNAEWEGVSLSEILSQVEVLPQARFVRLEGLDRPIQASVPSFIRSIPIEKLKQPDTLIAWGMNREPLPPLHGGPARLILPGWYGENWIKWIIHITFTEEPDSGFYMKKAYRVPSKPIQPGEVWDSSTGIPIEQILVQSFITSPRSEKSLPEGKTLVRGKAFSGAGSIPQVEISIDEGKTWTKAAVTPRRASGGWQEFQIEVNLSPETQWIFSRATDAQGNQQPLEHAWNPGGYVRNTIDRVRIHVVTKASSLGEETLNRKCVVCHSRELIESQRLTLNQWQGVLKKMNSFGVVLTPEENQSLIETLSNLSPDLPPVQPKPFSYPNSQSKVKLQKTTTQGALLFQANCSACHGISGQGGGIGPQLKGRSIPWPTFVQTVKTGRQQMPSFEAVLKEEQIRDIWSFISKKETRNVSE